MTIITNDLSSITGTLVTHELNDEFEDTCQPRNEIYGRNKERLAVLTAYQRLLQTKQAQTIVVHGKSGSGKTALVNTLRTQLASEHNPGYFVAGKYFQNEGGVQEAHSAIVAAFSDLCDLILQSDDFDEGRKQQIKESMGSDAELLIKSISNLATLVGNVSNTAKIVQDNNASVGKFKIACKTFLGAMASNSHPVVIFLDDVQWADEGSIQLIKMFLQDCALKNVMFILAYREEEAAKVDDMLSHARSSIDIHLSNIDDDAVYELVSSIVGSSSESVRDLSKLVSKRTSGNPFHVMLFMETIQREDFIVFNIDESCNFDVETIQMGIMANESSTDLLARKVELLSKDIIEILKVASLLGYHFQGSILVEVSCIILEAKASKEKEDVDGDTCTTQFSRDDVLMCLSDAVEEGFIETTTNGYQFTHDKLQAAFRAFINNREENRLHLLIGQAFLAHVDDEQALVYKAAVHLNCAPGFLYDYDQRLSLANINLKAALYCEQKSSFFQTVTMLQKGLSVIDSHQPWSEATFDVKFQLMESLAKTQLIIGDFEGCKETAKIALDHSKTVEMKINLLLIDVEVRMVGNEVEGSLAAAFRALRTLNVKMPKKVAFHHVVGKLLKVKRMLRGRTVDDLLQLPLNHQLLTTSAVKLLMHVCAYCLVKDEVNAGIYSALLATEITIKTGLSPHSSSAFVFYGVAEASLGNIDRAFKYGKMALTMLENMPSKEAECCTIGFALTMLTFQKEQFQHLVDPLHRAADAGYQRGDVLYATYSLTQAFYLHIYLGTNLADLEASMRKSYDVVSDLSQDGMMLWFPPALQYVINMQSERSSWENIAVLSGEIMREEDYSQKVCDSGHLALNMICSVSKAEIASYFEQFAFAAKIYDEVRSSNEETMNLSYGAPIYYWNAARTHYSLYEESGKWRHLRRGRRYDRLLKKMEAADCPSATPLVAFLDAQAMARRKHIDIDELCGAFDRGINTLAAHHFKMFEALLNEKAGFDFATRGMLELATQYFERALYLYANEIGATAKYNWLMKKSENALLRLHEISPPSPYGKIITVSRNGEGV